MINEMYQKFLDCFDRNGTIFVCGNGGSSAEASHLSEEFISLGYPVIALNDSSVITALSNDFSYEHVFSRYIGALGKKGDLLITLSTSGKSKNILNAIKTAKLRGLEIIEFPRKGKDTEDIQNRQLALIHRLYKRFK